MSDDNRPSPSHAGPGATGFPPPSGLEPSSDYPPPFDPSTSDGSSAQWAPPAAPSTWAPGGPMPQPPIGYPAPARKSNWWKWLLGTVLALVLIIGGCTYFFIGAVRGPLDAANQFFAAVNDGDPGLAESLVSVDPSCEFGPDPAQVIDQRFSTITLEEYFFAAATITTANGRTTADVVGVVRTMEDGEQTYTVGMVEAPDGWKVCSLNPTE